MTDFCDLAKSTLRWGRTADRPATPPDKSALFWDIETGTLYGVDDFMQWVELGASDIVFPLAIESGGTGTNLSGYGPGHLVQPTTGADVITYRDNFSAGAPPTASDDLGDGYNLGSLWFFGTRVWICADASVGAADWWEITGDASTISYTPADSADWLAVYGGDPADVAEALDALANTLEAVSAGGIIRSVCDGRLTLTTGVPVTTSNVTAATTVYFAPYKGSQIALYDGSGWLLHELTEISCSVPANTTTPFDLFVYENLGALVLEAVAWTNDTTRATNIVLQDGVWVKSGAAARRYLGTGRTTSVSGQTEDSVTKRFLWNYYHRVPRTLLVSENTNSWTYNSTTFRPLNNNSANRVEFVLGLEEANVELIHWMVAGSTAAAAARPGIGLDSTSVNSAQLASFGVDTSGVTAYGLHAPALYMGYPGIGGHYLQLLEAVSSAVSRTFYGDNNIADLLNGGFGKVWG